MAIITKEYLEQKHYVEDMLIQDIASELGVSRFVIGYNMRKYGLKTTPRTPDTTGRVFSEETIVKMRKSKIGAKNPSYNGGVSSAYGYIMISVGDNNYRPQHVLFMEEIIGRRLKKNEVVHHIDENKKNNDISNLRLMTRSAHSRLHNLKRIKENPALKYWGKNKGRMEEVK